MALYSLFGYIQLAWRGVMSSAVAAPSSVKAIAAASIKSSSSSAVVATSAPTAAALSFMTPIIPSATTLAILFYAPDAYLAYALWALSPVPLSLPTAVAVARVTTNIATNTRSMFVTSCIEDQCAASKQALMALRHSQRERQQQRARLLIGNGEAGEGEGNTWGNTLFDFAERCVYRLHMCVWQAIYVARKTSEFIRHPTAKTQFVL